MREPLLESAGGEVLAELVLLKQIDAALTSRNVPLTAEDLVAERAILGRGLSDDADRAARLLRELRQRRGASAFDRRLRINAGLRKLVAEEVAITPAATRVMYELTYGERYEARIIVVEGLQEAVDIVKALREGRSFTDLAIAHSTDVSRAQGGLMPPVSPADPTYPKGVREALTRLTEGQVSDPVALEGGYALLLLERKIAAQPIKFADVKDVMATEVRRQQEQILMQRELRTMLSTANVTVLHADLAQRWQQHKERLLEPDE